MMNTDICPKCGHEVEHLMICTNPPIPQKKCYNCGWVEEEKRGEYLPITGSFISGRIGKEYKETYKAEEDGIVKISEILDLDGEPIFATRQVVLSKEVFVAAYNAYIKDGE